MFGNPVKFIGMFEKSGINDTSKTVLEVIGFSIVDGCR